MTTYGDNWIRINAKKKVLQEQYLKENRKNNEQIVHNIATHLGTHFPHKGNTEASIADLKDRLNASGPHENHEAAARAIAPFVADESHLFRNYLGRRYSNVPGVDMDADLTGVAHEYLENVAYHFDEGNHPPEISPEDR